MAVLAFDWTDVPGVLRVGITVADAWHPVGTPQVSSAGVLAVTLESRPGIRKIVKAASRSHDPGGYARLQREVQVGTIMSRSLRNRRTPAIGSVTMLDPDQGTGQWGHWIAAEWGDIAGSPPRPGTQGDRELILAGLHAVAEDEAHGLDESDAFLAQRDGLGPVRFTAWRTFAERPAPATVVDPWVREHLAQLVDLETVAAAAPATALSRMNVRLGDLVLSDPILSETLPGGIDAWFLDWSRAAAGPVWLDALLGVLTLNAETAEPVGTGWAEFAAAYKADDAHVSGVLAGVAGDLLVAGKAARVLHAPDADSDRLRVGQAALRWLRTRLA